MSSSHFHSSVVIFFIPRYWFYLLGSYFWSFFIIFTQNLPENWSRCRLLASLGLLLASSGVPFVPPWTHFGAPWPPFCHAKTPLEANFYHFAPPSLILEGFFMNFLCFPNEILLFSISFLHIFFEGFTTTTTTTITTMTTTVVATPRPRDTINLFTSSVYNILDIVSPPRSSNDDLASKVLCVSNRTHSMQQPASMPSGN